MTTSPEYPNLDDAIAAYKASGWLLAAKMPDRAEMASPNGPERITLDVRPDGTVAAREWTDSLAARPPAITPAPKRGHALRNIGIGCGGLFALLVVLAIIGAAMSGSKASSSKPSSTGAASKPASSAEAAAPAVASKPPAPAVARSVAAPAPAPITLQGSGSNVSQNMPLNKGFTTFHFTYQGSSNFIVHLLDDQGKEVELLVNTIGSYDGTVAYGLPAKGNYVASIQASGPWSGAVEQPQLDSVAGDTGAQGTGNTVAYLHLDQGLRRLHFTHDGQRNFIVYIYNDAGNRSLLVNVIGAYDGTVPQTIGTGGGTFAIAIQADGNWSVSSQ